MEISSTVRHRFLRMPECAFARFTEDNAFLDFTLLARTVTVFLDPADFALDSVMAAWAAANRAIATRKGEQLT